VDPARPDAPEGRVERLYARAGRLSGDRLQRTVVGSSGLRPRPSLALIAATALSLLIIGALAGLLAFGAWAVVASGDLLVAIVGVVVLLFVWVCRPRPGSAPERGVVTRAQAPTLWGLVDRVAAALRTRPPDLLVVDGEWSASVGTVGWRRTTVLTLGLPLLGCLGPQERVALLGHELGHRVNGDVARSRPVAFAIETLENAAYVLEPEELVPEDPELGIAGWLALPLNLVLLGVSRLVEGLALVLLLIAYRDSQRAEYYADRLAGRLAGRTAAIRMLQTAGNDKPHYRAVQGLTIAENQVDLVDLVRRYQRETPPREIERLRLAERLAGARLDSTHPPTMYRIDLLGATGSPVAELAVSSAESERVDAELARFLPAIQERLVGEARDALYG
jgi:heat shock protein HtpX